MRKLSSSLLYIILLCMSFNLSHAIIHYPVYNISHFLGGGSVLGDGGLAINAQIDTPEGIAVNSKGEVFVVQNLYARVRKVDKNGYVSTVAGYGSSGDSDGNDGPATSATLGYPSGIAISDKDEIYLVEYSTYIIRKILANGIIKEFAGVMNAPGFGGDGGLATSANFKNPYAVALNPSTGDVFISDYNNFRIRKIDKNGYISTYAGAGGYVYGGDGGLAVDANFNGPYGIATNKNGDLFFTTLGSARILKVSNSTGIITTVAGTGTPGYSGDNGPAINATIKYPKNIVIGPNDEIFFTDTDNYRIRRIVNGIITTIAGTGTFGLSGDGGLATNADISRPTGITVDSNGTIYFCDNNFNRVRKLVPYCLEGDLVNGTCVFSCFGLHYNASNVCNSHGTCYGTNKCDCESGWKGNEQCSNFSCDGVNNCFGNGKCIGPNTCLCDSGWKGALNCSINSCEEVNNCNNRGLCISNNTCQCDSGWKGNLQCTQFSCDGVNNCSGHGSCISNNTCQCQDGWKGNSQCSAVSCEAVKNCNGRGVCTGSNVCSCSNGYFGRECQYYSCFNNPMLNYRSPTISEKLCLKINKQLLV